MDKKILIGIAGLIILAAAYWLISPLWRSVVLDEELPKDNLLTMDAETRADFEKQTAEMKDMVMEKGDVMPDSATLVVGRADMVARAHEVEGEALLVKSGDKAYLRFENLNTINGPDLRIYLSSDLSADDIIDLGPIRATKGNVNYAIPDGTDLGKYKNAMIWCRAFGVLFSYARF